MPVNNSLLQMVAQGGKSMVPEMFAQGVRTANAMREMQFAQEDRLAMQNVTNALAEYGLPGAIQAGAGTSLLQTLAGLHNNEQDRAFQQQKLSRPQSSLGKLEADFQAGRISEQAYRAKINSIGKGGTTVNVNTGNIPLGKKATNDVTKRVVAGREEQLGLSNIRDNFDSEFLTFQGQAKGALTRFAEKAGIGALVSPNSQATLKKQTRFKQAVQQTFNRYRKEITGAAAAVQELEQLKQALFNLGQSPTEFQAALDNYESMAQRLDGLRVQFLQQGIDPATPEGGRAFDNAFFGIAQQQGATLPQSPAQAIQPAQPFRQPPPPPMGQFGANQQGIPQTQGVQPQQGVIGRTQGGLNFRVISQ